MLQPIRFRSPNWPGSYAVAGALPHSCKLSIDVSDLMLPHTRIQIPRPLQYDKATGVRLVVVRAFIERLFTLDVAVDGEVVDKV